MSAHEQAKGRRAAGDDPALRRHRAYRRHHRRSRSGARGVAIAPRVAAHRGRIGDSRAPGADADFSSTPARSGAAVELRGANCMTIGLVNNMPDAACEATERQFLDLIRAATPRRRGPFASCSAMADVPRAEPRPAGARRALSRYCRTVGHAARRADRNRHRAARRESRRTSRIGRRWPKWSIGRGKIPISTVWSCLAAHAAVLHADGIARRPLHEKKFGVFDCENVVRSSADDRHEPRLPCRIRATTTCLNRA